MYDKGVQFMFGADRKAMFAKYCLDIWFHLLKQLFPKGQKPVFLLHCSTHLNYLWQIILFLFLLQIMQFFGNYWWILYLVIFWLSRLIQTDKPERLTIYMLIQSWPCHAIYAESLGSWMLHCYPNPFHCCLLTRLIGPWVFVV